MAATQNVPVSEIIRNKSSGDDEPKKKSREDWRKAKELEEARKAGTAPAAVDEEGKDINPHIPQYISQAPWYFGSKGPTLKHQRPQPEREKQFARVDDWYKRGVSTNAAIKYRKGACENCGAMTHKKKDCMERPRRVGAKFTGTNIAPDEFIQPELSMDYDGKRDRWAGYDPSEHKSIIEEYQKIEEAKRQLRAEKLNSNVDGNAETEDIDDDDEDKYVDEVDMPGTKVDSKQRITVRNLRIREDTAKYLRNLDPNSAYYDPKTRSMRDNPHAGTGVNEQDVDYAGENFVRFTGDTQKHSVAQLFAWEAYEKGVDVHLLAEPTKLEMLQHEYEKKKEQFKSQAQGSILEKYGGAEHLQAPPKALLLAQTEDYVEYSRYGKLIKGQEKQIIRSKYEEDIFPNNHTSVWGSYWQNGQWGYKCCHSFVKNSYCTGEAGKAAASDLQRGMKVETEPLAEAKNSSSSESDSSDSDDHSDKDSEETEKKKKQNKKKKKKEKKKKHLEKKRKGKKDSPEDKLKMALQQEDLNQQEAERILSMDERKRPYNSMFEVKKPTEEEIEAYYMKKRRDEDPMTQFMK
ncbi:pre-mRNA-splicing factor SLU7 [Schistocerca americana]|uniref:pre-mRNA-splicing factor SLU7 n=1 Tax=Schistocerca americana TaxID=7009 RepID=UPI001F50161B|nr:pre-mRNA-splicing factor SLU7 [Schistocerca americana]XP_046994623.1 pre-mRNA-splicing factor SLU7 [Schistocerca americana]XP_046994631.1 pre-mRNA-splicing factor SLU7 [Schistocerca americana]XP_046994640.1 pre-mRNA-splicing factor SLU7 [Schistocerca americana]